MPRDSPDRDRQGEPVPSQGGRLVVTSPVSGATMGGIAWHVIGGRHTLGGATTPKD